MKFDFVIGNPPYQEDRQGDSTTALPVYHTFMDSAHSVGKAVELITPARFLFNAGRTPKSWNEQKLNDEHFTVLHYEKDASIIFPSTEIKGGVAITYRDSKKTYEPIGTFTVYNELNSILSKVRQLSNTQSFSQLGFVASKFSKDLFVDYPQYSGHERRMSSNVLSFDCFHDYQEKDDIMIYGIVGRQRQGKYINRKYVDLSDTNIGLFKIVMPKADGNGNFGDTLATPEVLKPSSGFTHTFLGIGGFSTESEAKSTLKYIRSKFFRALLGILKVTQDLNADKFRYIPQQDFTLSSDIDWSQPIPQIDQQLYRKYGLTEEEITFIETHVKEMT